MDTIHNISSPQELQPKGRAGSLDQWLVGLAIFVSMLAICNNPTVSSICSRIMYPVWGFVGMMKLFGGRGLKTNMYFFALGFIWFLAILQGRFFHSLGYYLTGGAGVARTLIFCAIFYFLGFNLDKRTSIRFLMQVFVIGQIFLMYYRPSGLSLMTMDKNALGILVGSAMLFAIVIMPTVRKQVYQLMILFLLVVSLAFLVYLHTRTPIVAVMGALFYRYAATHKLRRTVAVMIFLGILVVLILPTLMQSSRFVNLLQGDRRYSELTLNSITSNRVEYYREALRDFRAHPFIGMGGWAYVDCFPLFVLRAGGLLSMLLIFPITYGKFYNILKYHYKLRKQNVVPTVPDDHMLLETSVMLVVYYSLMSICEGNPPIGPGTSTFFLWIVLGKYDSVFSSKGGLHRRAI